MTKERVTTILDEAVESLDAERKLAQAGGKSVASIKTMHNMRSERTNMRHAVNPDVFLPTY